MVWSDEPMVVEAGSCRHYLLVTGFNPRTGHRLLRRGVHITGTSWVAHCRNLSALLEFQLASSGRVNIPARAQLVTTSTRAPPQSPRPAWDSARR